MMKHLIISAALSLGLITAAHADLRIQFVGMDIGYNNGADNALFDAGTGGSTGGAGNPGDGDEALITFFDDSTLLGFELGWLDFNLPVNQITVGAPVTSSGAGYFDILLGSTNGFGLGITNVTIATSSNFDGVFDLVGSIGTIDDSILPFAGLNIGEPITLSFSSQVSPGGLDSNPDGTVNSFVGFGTGEVQSVPEPAALALLGLGLVAVGFTRRRRKA